MNTNHIKKYAPKARNAFIATMVQQAAKYGITQATIAPAVPKGELLIIGDQPFPAAIQKPRQRLVQRIEQQGFEQVMEHVAYSWFNRFCAIRYMELKGFFEHGLRVLSAADGSAGVAQILEECLDLELPGLDQAKVRLLKLDGTQDELLYRELLLAQCRDLHTAMPFLFEAVADESELLLPENLTKTDSIIRDLVTSIPDENWSEIEIIGWLYQFYISEKKDQVIGKVVKSEDIPAATQLFTPNWIVQYLVQNSVGRQWLQTYPDSPLKQQMPYYIEPAQQTEEVQAQLAAITPAEITPESIKVLDPACGSGHILVEAYKVLKAIYEERGYRARDIPKLILEHNLFGLDIDDRAGQLAGFTLMMLAREDDRRIFARGVALNVLALQEPMDIDLPLLWRSLNLTGEWGSGSAETIVDLIAEESSQYKADTRYLLLERTLASFAQAKTFGSLIQIPQEDFALLQELLVILRALASAEDSIQSVAAKELMPFVQQGAVLAQQYDAVVANPPYMGGKYQTPVVKKALKEQFLGYEKDLFSVFIVRNLQLTKQNGQLGFMTPFVWMFISSYEKLRSKLIDDEIISTLVQLEYSGFDGATVPICTFTLTKGHIADYTGSYVRLSDFKGAINQGPKTLEAISNHDCGWFYEAKPDDFKKIPGSPIAYWVLQQMYSLFQKNRDFSSVATIREGISTGDNEKFLRYWWEVHSGEIFNKQDVSKNRKKWVRHNKGGGFRRWYGNQDYIMNWQNNGVDVKAHGSSTIRGEGYFFQPSVSWSRISSGSVAMRFYPEGFSFDSTAPSFFSKDKETLFFLAGLLNSKVSSYLLKALSPTLDFRITNLGRLPIIFKNLKYVSELVLRSIHISRLDFDLYEVSNCFIQDKIITNRASDKLVSDAFDLYSKFCDAKVFELRMLEESINKCLIVDYGLSHVLESKIKIYEVSINSNFQFVYCDLKNAKERFKSEAFTDFISYSLGCMMGRYSLDRESLVYAHAKNEGFSDLVTEGAYKTFPADDDGIIPLTDQEWFPDDATNRFREFVKTVWSEDHLQENLDFVAESLCLHAIKPLAKKGQSESALDTIRRYLSTQFFKDHLKTYKKRPIYWLFSSGKQKAFECLVYLHRYNEGTLSRMRTEYVIPLMSKMAAYEQKLTGDKDASDSAAEIKRIEKEVATLHKQQAELSEFDEKLRHYADQRISIDLDDGVKVNYGKFGDLLAEVKAVTGQKPEIII